MEGPETDSYLDRWTIYTYIDRWIGRYNNTTIWQYIQCSVAKVDYRGAAAPQNGSMIANYNALCWC